LRGGWLTSQRVRVVLVEAATPRSIEGDKAQRIVEAMRASVAQRGVAASTFDHVAREAGVSRGLLHYYFQTKERLLAEVVRRDSDLRIGVLERQLAGATSADDFIDLLVFSLEGLVREDPDFVTLVFELFTLSRRNEEVAAELAGMLARSRDHVATLLAAKEREGVLHLRAAPEAVTDLLFSLADGISLRMLAEPDRDFADTIRAGTVAVRALLDDR
jgi:AcrR family transcriptional regulator